MKYHIVQVSDEALSVTCLDLFYLCTIMTLEIKILQFFIDTGKTGTQNSLYPMQLLPFFYFFIGTAVSGRASGKRRLEKRNI